jgi:hypothetical protein
MEAKFSNLNQQSYSVPARLGFLTKLCVAGALICGISSHVGDGIAKKDVCFYPESAQKQDDGLRATRKIPYKNAPKYNMRGRLKSEDSLLLGKKYCRPEHVATIPNSYFTANRTKSSNPNYNAWAFLSQDGLSSKALYVLRDLPSNNPYKLPLGFATAVFGMVGLASVTREQDVLTGLRPHYRATQQFESIRANYSVQMGEKLLELSGIELLRILRGIKVAEARQQFIATVTPQQQTALLMAMSAEDYHEYGYLLDSGASFDKFQSEEPAPQQQPQLPHGNPGTYDQINSPSDKLPTAGASSIAWVNNLVKQTSLIWGNQGGGKSWLARYTAAMKLKAGYKVVVLDPDSNPSEWKGVSSYHSWEDIENQIQWYVDELQNRLTEFNNSTMNDEEWQAKLLADGRAVAFIVEEATTYTSFIKNEELLDTFGKLALTKSRKQLMPITVVAHNNTQSCLFGIKSLGNLVSKMLQVQCLAEVNKETLKPQSTGKAKVKLDSSNEWLDALLPTMKTKLTDFTPFKKLAPAQEQTSTIKPNDMPEVKDVHSAPTVVQNPINESEDNKTNNEASFDELLEAIVKSFEGKEATKIKRIPSGCNRIRVALNQFDKQNHEKILVLLVEALVKLGKAQISDNNALTQKVKDGLTTLSPEHDFLII